MRRATRAGNRAFNHNRRDQAKRERNRVKSLRVNNFYSRRKENRKKKKKEDVVANVRR